MIKRFIAYYKPVKKLFAFDMFCALIVAAADLFYPMIARNIINVFVPNKDLANILIWCGILLAVYLLKAIMNYIVSYYGHVMGVKMQAHMRHDMFIHLQKLPFNYFDNTKTGTIMSRLMNDLFDVSELAHHGPENLFLAVVMFIGSFIMLSGINLELTLIIFAFLPFLVLAAVLMRLRMREAFRISREKIAEVNADVETAVSGIRVSRAYTASKHETERFDKGNAEFVKARSGALEAMGRFHTVMTLSTDIMYLVVIAAGGLFYLSGRIDIGDFTAFLLYISLFLTPVRRVIDLFQQLQEGMTGFRRFIEIIDLDPEAEAADAIDCGDLKGNIDFNNVSFSYADSNASENDLVVNGLSMHIGAGRTIALVGPSGGGKTTICNLIPRFYELSGGSITIDGTDITHMTRESLRRNIGMVAQDVFLFAGTVRDNIAYGKPDATDEEIEAAARRANIHEFVMSLPDGYNTNVGERGVKLSGGQKQRISIARVFLKDPPILILDEATSALDNATEMMIQQSLEELSNGRTVLVVAHRLSTVKNADEIVLITHDGIVERGNHEELMKLNGQYASLYKYQFKE